MPRVSWHCDTYVSFQSIGVYDLLELILVAFGSGSGDLHEAERTLRHSLCLCYRELQAIARGGQCFNGTSRGETRRNRTTWVSLNLLIWLSTLFICPQRFTGSIWRTSQCIGEERTVTALCPGGNKES